MQFLIIIKPSQFFVVVVYSIYPIVKSSLFIENLIVPCLKNDDCKWAVENCRALEKKIRIILTLLSAVRYLKLDILDG